MSDLTMADLTMTGLKQPRLTKLQQNIINQYQKGFPISSRPYLAMAEQLNSTETDVFEAVLKLNEEGMLSRVGAVFNHKKAGASTLAAIAAPQNELTQVAAIVSQFEQVNHNYAREHDFNLWFVVTAHNEQALNAVLKQIEQQTGYAILVLPMEASYHIDLAFNIDFSRHTQGNSND